MGPDRSADWLGTAVHWVANAYDAPNNGIDYASKSGSQAYDPWGTVTATSGVLSGGMGFQGAWADPATGKDLMGARWYNPAAGDFTSADTIQVPPVPDPAAGNPYAYAADNPLGATDPTGHVLIPMLPDGGSYYRTAPPPARPVIPPPPPPSYYLQQAAQAFTAMAHSMGSAKPADAHKTAPPPKPTAKARPVTRPKPTSRAAPVPAVCATNMNACLLSTYRSEGGKVDALGIPTTGNPDLCGGRVCTDLTTGKITKPAPEFGHLTSLAEIPSS